VKPGHAALTLIPVDSSSIAMASVIALRAVLDAGYTGPKIERQGKAGSAFRVSEPTPLDTLTMRAAGASRSSGRIARALIAICYTSGFEKQCVRSFALLPASTFVATRRAAEWNL
jgi:hypothetical protein